MTATATAGAPEQSRARYPDREGFVERAGVRTFYEVYGDGATTILLLPTYSIIPSRHWKAQIHYLARHFRVVSFDGRGSGRSDRPAGAAAYAEAEFAADALAVMDATGTDRAVLAALSCGCLWATLLAADHPDRVLGVAYLGPSAPLAPGHSVRAVVRRFEEELDTDEGWAKYNRAFWRRDYRAFLEYFFGEMFPEPHSTKQIEDCVGWGLEADIEKLGDATSALGLCGLEVFAQIAARIRCPVLVIHGDDDRIRPHAQGAALARLTGGELVTIEGGGHGPQARDPVKVNLLLRAFAERVAPPAAPAPRVSTWTRAGARRRRALYVSSPIGLGHARRDLAIARELRALHPDLEIDWLAQHPLTAVLEAEGERIHPASALLASESAHMTSESTEHRLDCFGAIRRMDEILLANYMVFDEVVHERPYDLWIGDEAWDVDHFLHENPERKCAPYAWLTDFVGWLPSGDDAVLTADYNAEMLEQIARYPQVRDRSLFVGHPEDVVADDFGPGLPAIREWTEAHYAFPGYVSAVDAADVADRARLRAELGYRDDERVCVVTVGGSGVGGALLRRVIDALPAARALVPGLRMVAVAGPRIDPASFPTAEGLEVHAYVHDLHRHLAACDVAVVQGGLTTGMELTAAKRPFLVFPLRDHFEQQRHVRHRLERYGAARYMDYETDGPEQIATAIAEELGREVDCLHVEPGGARRAAALIAELL